MKTISRSESRRTRTLVMRFLFLVLIGCTQSARAQWSGTPNIYYNGGNVGIGTASPVEKLDVNGSINMPSGYNFTWGGSYGADIPTVIGVSGAGAHIQFRPAGT